MVLFRRRGSTFDPIETRSTLKLALHSIIQSVSEWCGAVDLIVTRSAVQETLYPMYSYVFLCDVLDPSLLNLLTPTMR